ncbi:MAG: peptide-methionine (S)-S-oxide reductase MsrA [Candidatus Odinarchaeota archaeon]
MVSVNESELATLGGGCFWCIEAIFADLRGVKKVESGYSGGKTTNPTYDEVCTGATDHAEVVQITFNPQIISFRELLEIFFAFHDPTTLNRQGNDVGTQYRSAVFYHTQDQKTVSEEVIAELERKKIWNNPIVTGIEPYTAFYRAEDYHQEYYQRNSDQAYCQFVITPKIVKFRKKYSDRLKN